MKDDHCLRRRRSCGPCCGRCRGVDFIVVQQTGGSGASRMEARALLQRSKQPWTDALVTNMCHRSRLASCPATVTAGDDRVRQGADS